MNHQASVGGNKGAVFNEAPGLKQLYDNGFGSLKLALRLSCAPAGRF